MHVLYIRTLLRILQAGIKNTNLLIENLSKLLRKNRGSVMRAKALTSFGFRTRIHCFTRLKHSEKDWEQ